MTDTQMRVSQQMVDMVAPKMVQVQISADGSEVWVNVDGICRFRAKQIKHVDLDDERLQVAMREKRK